MGLNVVNTETIVNDTYKDRIIGAIIGSLVSDALCLGTHYEYNATKIKTTHRGDVIGGSRFLSPGEMMGGKTHGIAWGSRNYHPGKKAGDNTDYGEQNIILLEYLEKAYLGGIGFIGGGRVDVSFSLIDFFYSHWRLQYIPDWQSGSCRACGAWIDLNTKTLLRNIGKGLKLHVSAGNTANQIIRFVGALGLYESEEELIRVARDTTRFTHNEQRVIAVSEFWARATHRVLREMELEDAFNDAANATQNDFVKERLAKAISVVQEAENPTSILSQQYGGDMDMIDDAAIISLSRLWDIGRSEPLPLAKTSSIDGSFPSSLYFILKYKNLESASIANAKVGGDNANRAIAIGMVLGAYQGLHAGIPMRWINDWNAYFQVWKILEKLPLTGNNLLVMKKS